MAGLRWLCALFLGAASRATIVPMDVQMASELSLRDFKIKYVNAMMPVVIRHEAAAEEWPALKTWSRDYLDSTCAGERIESMLYHNQSLEWGGFAEKEPASLTFGELFDSWQEDAPPRYGFDFDMKCQCPKLLEDFGVLKYFHGDAKIGMPLQESYNGWPALMIGAEGTQSGIHVDNNLMPFWMTVLQGKKRFRVIRMPEIIDTLVDKVFEDHRGQVKMRFDLFNDEFLNSYKPLKNVNIYDVWMEPGDTIYMPTGAAHGARNFATPTAAATSNFIDEWHRHQVGIFQCELFAFEDATDVDCLYIHEVLNTKWPSTPTEETPLSRPYYDVYVNEGFCTKLTGVCPKLEPYCADVGGEWNKPDGCADRGCSELFEEIDENGNGWLSALEFDFHYAKEIASAWETADMAHDEKTFRQIQGILAPVKEMFARADTDADGLLSPAEYMAMPPEAVEELLFVSAEDLPARDADESAEGAEEAGVEL